MTYTDWSDLVRMAERHGFRLPADNIGLAGENVGLFARALQRGLEQEELETTVRDAAAKLLDFVRGPGRDGFKQRPEWN